MNGFKNYNRDIANRLFLEERVKYCQRISGAAPPLIARSFQGLGRMMLRAPPSIRRLVNIYPFFQGTTQSAQGFSGEPE